MFEGQRDQVHPSGQAPSCGSKIDRRDIITSVCHDQLGLGVLEHEPRSVPGIARVESVNGQRPLGFAAVSRVEQPGQR